MQVQGLVSYDVPHFKRHVRAVHSVNLGRPPYIAEIINSTQHSCLLARVSPTYQTRTARLDRQKTAAIARLHEMNDNYGGDRRLEIVAIGASLQYLNIRDKPSKGSSNQLRQTLIFAGARKRIWEG